MRKRQQLYYLLKAYKRGEYDISTFCDQLSLILYYESSAINELVGKEKDVFAALGKVVERYSPFEEDRETSIWYVGEKDVEKAIKAACFEGVKKSL